MARRRRSREAAADQLLLSVEHAAEEMNPADVPDWRLRLMLARAIRRSMRRCALCLGGQARGEELQQQKEARATSD